MKIKYTFQTNYSQLPANCKEANDGSWNLNMLHSI